MIEFYRFGPSDWPGGDDAWRAFRLKEPVNAHSHLIAMLLGRVTAILCPVDMINPVILI